MPLDARDAITATATAGGGATLGPEWNRYEEEERLLTMMLVISIVMGIVPLLGIAWTIATGTIMSVDGLFMSLILLTLSGVFFLNAYWELRDRGALAFLKRKKLPAPAAPIATAKPAETKTAKAQGSEV